MGERTGERKGDETTAAVVGLWEKARGGEGTEKVERARRWSGSGSGSARLEQMILCVEEGKRARKERAARTGEVGRVRRLRGGGVVGHGETSWHAARGGDGRADREPRYEGEGTNLCRGRTYRGARQTQGAGTLEMAGDAAVGTKTQDVRAYPKPRVETQVAG